MNRSLVVFLRKPIRGQVKRRLAETLGEEKALEIYRWLLDLTRQVLAITSYPIHLYFDTDAQEAPFWTKSFQCHVQHGENLGDRMANAFFDQLEEGLPKQVVMIGSDCPEISEEMIDKAFKKLNSADLVFGPSFDGGVYLIGVTAFDPVLFEGIQWSSSSVFSQLQLNARRLKLTFDVLPEKSDIDYEEDFLKFEHLFHTYQQEKTNELERKG
jgi:rSAM/selenodomain-associated transferase 1